MGFPTTLVRVKSTRAVSLRERLLAPVSVPRPFESAAAPVEGENNVR